MVRNTTDLGAFIKNQRADQCDDNALVTPKGGKSSSSINPNVTNFGYYKPNHDCIWTKDEFEENEAVSYHYFLLTLILNQPN